jgi:hypothetical protein
MFWRSWCIAPSTSADGTIPAHFDLPLPEMARCTVCFAEGAKKCRNCKSIFYCPDNCKKSDGYLHKCGKFTKFATQHPRPSDEALLAIKLETDSHFPKLDWVQGGAAWNMQIVKQGNEFNNPSKIDYIDAEEPPLVAEKRIHEHAIPSLTNLEDTVAIHYLDTQRTEAKLVRLEAHKG